MSRDAFPRLDREYNEREERLDEARGRIKEHEAAMRQRFVESPENHEIVRLALEKALREFLNFTAPFSVPTREYFLSYIEGRFGLDKALVEKVKR